MIKNSKKVLAVEYFYLASMYMATGQYLKCSNRREDIKLKFND